MDRAYGTLFLGCEGSGVGTPDYKMGHAYGITDLRARIYDVGIYCLESMSMADNGGILFSGSAESEVDVPDYKRDMPAALFLYDPGLLMQAPSH